MPRSAALVLPLALLLAACEAQPAARVQAHPTAETALGAVASVSAPAVRPDPPAAAPATVSPRERRYATPPAPAQTAAATPAPVPPASAPEPARAHRGAGAADLRAAVADLRYWAPCHAAVELRSDPFCYND